MSSQVKIPSWLKEMFDTGKLSLSYQPEEMIISIIEGKYYNCFKPQGKVNSDRIRVGILVDGPFIPPTEGASTRILSLAKYCQASGCEVIIFKCRRECDDIEKFRQASKQMNLSFHLISPYVFYNHMKKMVKILSLERLDILQTKDTEILLTIGIELKKNDSVKICFDSHDVQHVLLTRLHASNKIIQEMQQLEVFSNEKADLHLCVSEIDKENFLIAGCREEIIHVIPNGVDFAEIIPYGPSLEKKNVLFLGNMCYLPNFQALKTIKKMTQDKLIGKNNINFMCVGTYPTSFMNNQNSNLIMTGPIENLNEVFVQTSICIAPITSGSGTRVKILYYFASGLPVISTTIGAEGLNVKNNENIIIEDDFGMYPKKIYELLNNKNFAFELGRKGQKIAEKFYNWSNLAKSLVGIYEKCRGE